MTVLNKKYLFSLIKCIDTKNQRTRLEQKEETALYVFCPMKTVSQNRYLPVTKKKKKNQTRTHFRTRRRGKTRSVSEEELEED